MTTQLFLCRSELTAKLTRKVLFYDGTLSMNTITFRTFTFH